MIFSVFRVVQNSIPSIFLVFLLPFILLPQFFRGIQYILLPCRIFLNYYLFTYNIEKHNTTQKKLKFVRVPSHMRHQPSRSLPQLQSSSLSLSRWRISPFICGGGCSASLLLRMLSEVSEFQGYLFFDSTSHISNVEGSLLRLC